MEQLHEAACTCSRGLMGANGHKQWFYEWLKLEGPSALDARNKIVV